MVESLINDDPEKPWAEFTRGKPLTQNRLAKLLGAYRIISQTVTPPGKKDAKGYYCAPVRGRMVVSMLS